jgi:hypothetical protein
LPMAGARLGAFMRESPRQSQPEGSRNSTCSPTGILGAKLPLSGTHETSAP